MEDQIIDVMEQIEPLDSSLAAFAEERAVFDARTAELETELTEAAAEIDAELERVESDRAQHVAEVPDELLGVYHGLRSVPGRIGVARLVGGTCHGCHLELPAVEVDRLKHLPSDQLVTCEECGCILVR